MWSGVNGGSMVLILSRVGRVEGVKVLKNGGIRI